MLRRLIPVLCLAALALAVVVEPAFGSPADRQARRQARRSARTGQPTTMTSQPMTPVSTTMVPTPMTSTVTPTRAAYYSAPVIPTNSYTMVYSSRRAARRGWGQLVFVNEMPMAAVAQGPMPMMSGPQQMATVSLPYYNAYFRTENQTVMSGGRRGLRRSFYVAPTTVPSNVVMFLQVPQNAKVWINGTATPESTASIREFYSPQLPAGQQGTYTVKATWKENGQEVTRTREVPCTTGQTIEVNLTLKNKEKEKDSEMN